jgi:phospho-N-acetylmuramoyl-pentapeptide-transferase
MSALWVGICCFGIEIALQSLWIRKQLKWNVLNKQKDYGPQIDVEIKERTSTMGGLVFILLALAAAMAENTAEGWGMWTLPLLCGLIGLADDWMKFARISSEGFSSLRKLSVQIAVLTGWSLFYLRRWDVMWWPGWICPKWIALPLLIFLGVGLLNAINVTDGLDGLAAGCMVISLTVLLMWLRPEGMPLIRLAVSLGVSLGFLWHNFAPASVFMGDSGAHFLGGMLFSLAIQNGFLLALFPLSFLFGLEIISVAVQIVSIRKYRKKIFLMAPLHHHFQKMGWSDTKIVGKFWLVHLLGLTLIGEAVSYWVKSQ